MNPYEIPTAVQPLPNRALVLDYSQRIGQRRAAHDHRTGAAHREQPGRHRQADDHVAPRRLGGAGLRLYTIPKKYLPVPGQPVVDFGHCLLRLDAA